MAFAVLGFTLLYDMSQDKYLQSASSTVAGEAPRSPWQDFIDIKYSVNAAYRSNAKFSLVCNDGLDQYFARAVGTDGHPVFRDWGMMNTARGAGMVYGGMNILSDYSLATPVLTTAANNRPVGIIGDMSWFWIRRVAGMAMIRDPFTNAANLATNWVFGRRVDSKGLFNTGTNPAAKQVQLDIVA